MILVLSIVSGCGGGSTTSDAGTDAFVVVDAGHEPDAAMLPDVGIDVGSDAGIDGGSDAGSDAATVDAFVGDAGPLPGELAVVGTFLGGLSAYRVLDTGGLEAVAGSPYDHGTSYIYLAAHPSGRWIYAVDGIGGNIVTFDVQADGTLLRRGALHLDAGPGPLAFHPNGQILYVGLSTPTEIGAFPVDATGALGTPTMTPLMADANAIVVDSGAHFVDASLSAGISVLALDAAGVPTEVSGSPFDTAHTFAGGIAVDPTGALLLHVRFELSAFRIAANGTATRIVPDPSSEPTNDASAMPVVIDATGRFAYAAVPATGHVLSFRVDAAAGTVDPLGTATPVGSPYSLALDPTGRFLYVPGDDGNIRGFVRDLGTGMLGAALPGPTPLPGLQPAMVIVARP